jgi:exodeoxyribonuclease VII small subunit
VTETTDDRPQRTLPEESSYEDLVQMLETSVARLETGQLDLEDALLEYEFGMRIIERCNQMLDQAELRITELSQGAQWTENDQRGS